VNRPAGAAKTEAGLRLTAAKAANLQSESAGFVGQVFLPCHLFATATPALQPKNLD
jgi:hypothetical protein